MMPDEHQAENPRGDAKLAAALARLLCDTKAGILLNEHIAEDGATVFAHARQLGAEGVVSKRADGAYQSDPCRVWIKVRNPASIAVQRERSENWNRRSVARRDPIPPPPKIAGNTKPYGSATRISQDHCCHCPYSREADTWAEAAAG